MQIWSLNRNCEIFKAVISKLAQFINAKELFIFKLIMLRYMSIAVLSVAALAKGSQKRVNQLDSQEVDADENQVDTDTQRQIKSVRDKHERVWRLLGAS